MVALWSPEFACVLQKGTTSGKASTQLNIDTYSLKKKTLSIACKGPAKVVKGLWTKSDSKYSHRQNYGIMGMKKGSFGAVSQKGSEGSEKT